ncbi:hypothetical protein [Bradyrhizobium iriomotense]|uniref:hypothetical protein n=1 Tax=Bradyrhizobium iriomotense TaxID=441950 RepID=UPI001B8A73B2|nr:hypothetical protein [Bradyrhizobium iriomotense]MBR1130933.1 hypothetical protein [Bradyrhizobium iriomotense]
MSAGDKLLRRDRRQPSAQKDYGKKIENVRELIGAAVGATIALNPADDRNAVITDI